MDKPQQGRLPFCHRQSASPGRSAAHRATSRRTHNETDVEGHGKMMLMTGVM